jgi:hypothetical protein
MPKQYNIKWRKSDREKISKTVRRFNAKITRTLKKHPEFAPYLPEKITVKELMGNIGTRKDFNREVNSFSRFLKRGAEKPYTSKSGIKTTAWERREVGYKVAQINRQRTIEKKRANVSTYKGTMGSIQANNLNPKKYNIDKIRPQEWDKFIETVEKQVKSNYNYEKMERYKENYIKGLYNVFGTKGNDILGIVENIPPDEFTDLFYNDPVLQLDFIYDPIEVDLKIESIIEHFESNGYA